MSYSPRFRGTQANAASRQIETNYLNASGAFMPLGSVVSSDTSGHIVFIDITDTNSVARLVGLTAVDMAPAATGGVIPAGRVEGVTTSFAIGDALYVNVDGTLTNVKPDYGVGSFVTGCFVIFVGVVVRNEFDPTKKDIQINPTVVGQL